MFSCRIEKSRKVLSLCASGDLADGRGALAYRFGTPGKVELRFPASPEGSLQRFRHAHYFRAQTDYTEVSFANGGFAYTIFDYRSSEDGYARHERGVHVAPASGATRETRLECARGGRYELETLEGVVPCDRESALSMGNCGAG